MTGALSVISIPDEDAVFDDLKIRNKLILLMAGPVVIILLLSVIGARARQASASASRTVETQVSLARANSDVVDALQQESLYSSAYVAADRKAWEKELKAARTNTDTVLAQALPRLQGDMGGASDEVKASAGLAVGAVDKLGPYRASVDQGFRSDQFSELIVNYTNLEDTFLAVNANVAASMSDPQAAAELRAAAALGGYKSAQGREGSVVSAAAEQGSFGSDKAFAILKDARTAEVSELAQLNSISDEERKGAVRDAMASDDATLFQSVRDQAQKAGASGKVDFDGKAVVGAASTVVQDLHTVETGLYQQLIGASQTARAGAERSSNLFLFAAIVGILGAVGAALFLGRRITRPLGKLTEAADYLSGEQMPRLIESLKNPSEEELGFQIGAMKPIEIDSDDEIGRLARSFNEVQRVAGEVAAEQALLLRKGIGEMFVNLARRNQALLDRQIEFIDELERGEEDPDQLDNLYRLDHLATRMRRNAESLLVLAGAEPPRRRGRPAPLANVVRAALAEVEDFGRIELLSFDEVLMASNAAADLAHLLSELMENATNFSPPETKVEVVGHKTKADGYVISVTDHGIGMSPDQVIDANESLAKPPLVGLTMSRSLGFIVVGRLAARHGIAVRMMQSAAGGVTAVVSIPPSLVVDTPGGMAEPQQVVEAPARLKPILDSPTSGLAPLTFMPAEGEPAPFSMAPKAVPDPPAAPTAAPAEAPAAWANEPAAAPTPAPAPASPPPLAAVPPLAEPPAANMPPPAIFGNPVADPKPEPAVEPAASAELAAEVNAAVEPAMPAALSFSAPEAPLPPSVEAAATARLDGVPPRSPQNNKPFFLEDATPPRPFGIDAPPGTPPAAKAEPPAAPAAPRLFGGGAPAAPAPAPPNAVAPAAPLATRTPARPSAPAAAAAPAPPAPPAAPAPLAARQPRPPAAPGAPAAPSADAATPAAPVATTTSGLAKRVPRTAGATRAIPGAEAERGVSATRRSPEEIRKMLSQHSAGRQRARAQEPVPAGAPDERETHE